MEEIQSQIETLLVATRDRSTYSKEEVQSILLELWGLVRQAREGMDLTHT